MRRLWPISLPVFFAFSALIAMIGLVNHLSTMTVGDYFGQQTLSQKTRMLSWFLAFAGTASLLSFAIGVMIFCRGRRKPSDDSGERQQMREKLANTTSLLHAIISETPGMVYAKDLEGKVILANPAAQAMIGKPWAEIEGRTAAEYLPDAAQASAIIAHDRRIMDSEIAETVEFTLPTEGIPRVWLSTKAPLRGDSGKVAGLVVISVDITERKAAATKLQILGNELAHMGRLNAMGELSLALAHELNQPLAAIVNHIAIAEHVILQKEMHEYSDIVKCLSDATDQAMRAGHIVKRLGSFAATQQPEKQPQNVADLVTEAAELISGMVSRKGLTIALSIEDRDARIMADRVQIQKVVVNLVRNASDALENLPVAKPEISVIVRSTDNATVEIIVEDDGPDMNSGQRLEIFERFSTDRYQGSDLGIPISLRILENHDGKLSYDSGIRGGVRLIATLPRY